MQHSDVLDASFRDPAGRMYRREGRLYRQLNKGFESDYELLMNSGLYQHLVEKRLLVEHSEADLSRAHDDHAAKVLQPQELAYISYPWEWSFSQLRDAALATLDIQMAALDFGLVLKDASAFNIQFHDGRPLFIDTLSFEAYEEGRPWSAYRQFCQHFLAPLALASYRDYRLVKLMRSYIDGIPLDLASQLLPRRSWLRYSILANIHLHARAQQRFADEGRESKSQREVKVSLMGMRGLIDGLASGIKRLQWRSGPTEWGDYYADTNYEDTAMQAKTSLVERFLDTLPGQGLLLDMGANTGRFSRLGLARGYQVVAMDVDELAVERAYLAAREQATAAFLPLVQDLANPTPALGWAHRERMSLVQRGPAEVVMALALIHHLAISNNVPLVQCAEYFAQLGQYLIIEFVPKSDSQVARLLSTREDIFPDYDRKGFEAAFSSHFSVLDSQPIEGSERQLYLMQTRQQ